MADNTHRCRADDIPEDTVAKTLESQVASLDPQRTESYASLQTVRTARASGYAREQKRLALKYGEDSPRVQAVAAKTRINQGLLRDLDFERARAGSETPTVDANGYVFHGFVRNLQGQGLAKLTVALYDEKGNWLRELGHGCTDERGYFILRFQRQQRDPATGAKPVEGERIAATQPTARIYVLDANQKTLHIEPEPLQPKLGQVDFRIIVLGAQTRPCPPPPETPGPAPVPTPTPTPRTSLDKLDTDEATRKRLTKAGIIDVEGMLETDLAKLADIVGSRDLAAKLIEQAKAILGTKPAERTPLSQLDIDDATRRRLEKGGITDVEGILETDPAKLAEIVGDAATAKKLRERAQAVIDAKGTIKPNAAAGARKPPPGRQR